MAETTTISPELDEFLQTHGSVLDLAIIAKQVSDNLGELRGDWPPEVLLAICRTRWPGEAFFVSDPNLNKDSSYSLDVIVDVKGISVTSRL